MAIGTGGGWVRPVTGGRVRLAMHGRVRPDAGRVRARGRPGLVGAGRGEAGSGRRAERSLRPVRTFLPRRATLLKTTLVTILLAGAVGLLWLPDAEGPPAPAAPTPSPLPDPTPSGTGAPSGQAPPPDAPARPGTGPALPAGTVGVPVRMAEPAVLAVVRPGSRVDLMLVPAPETAPLPATEAAPPSVVAAAALVLDVVDPGAVDGAGALYLALAPEQARRVVAAPPDARFAVVIRS